MGKSEMHWKKKKSSRSNSFNQYLPLPLKQLRRHSITKVPCFHRCPLYRECQSLYMHLQWADLGHGTAASCQYTPTSHKASQPFTTKARLWAENSPAKWLKMTTSLKYIYTFKMKLWIIFLSYARYLNLLKFQKLKSGAGCLGVSVS